MNELNDHKKTEKVNKVVTLHSFTEKSYIEQLDENKIITFYFFRFFYPFRM